MTDDIRAGEVFEIEPTTSGVVALVSSLILLGHGLSVKRIVARTSEECWGALPELELDDSET